MGFLKKITRPISKALDKIVPNEIKPFLPYVAAVAPMIYSGGLGGTNVFQQMLRRAALSGGLNLGAQLAQEGSEGDFSVGSLGLASLTGALTTPGSSELLGARAGIAAEQPGTLAKIKSSGLQALSKGAGFLEGGAETLRTDPFSMAGLKAATVPIAQGTTDVAMATARKALKDYEDELAAFNEQAGATTTASNLARRNAIISSMTAAAFDEDTIDDTLAQLGLRNGGRVGYKDAGFVTLKDLGITKRTEIEPKFEYNLKDFDLSKESPKVIIMNENGETQIMDEKLAKKLGAKIIVDSFDTEQILVRDKKANGGIMTAKRGLVNAPGGYAGEEEMDRGEGINIGIGKLYPKMVKQRAGEVVDFLSPSNIKDMPKDFSNFLKKSFNDPEGPYQTIKQDMMKSKDKKSSSDEGFGGIEKAVESVEQKPKTFLVDKLKVTVNPGESQEKAMLNAMFNDVDDVMPQDRKEEFYRLLIPKLKNTGEISDNEYEMLMQEVFSKAKGGIISLNMGGSVLPKGIEMDLRGGGFIPMGSMEKADDVPARVSKNEFVMTADAVRAAGGGSINKGAQRMYQLMNNLEARA